MEHDFACKTAALPQNCEPFGCHMWPCFVRIRQPQRGNAPLMECIQSVPRAAWAVNIVRPTVYWWYNQVQPVPWRHITEPDTRFVQIHFFPVGLCGVSPGYRLYLLYLLHSMPTLLMVMPLDMLGIWSYLDNWLYTCALSLCDIYYLLHPCNCISLEHPYSPLAVFMFFIHVLWWP